MVRYRYRPEHPWRHGFRRERRRKRILILAKLLFLTELAYFACGYVKAHTIRETSGRQELSNLPFGSEQNSCEVFGIGFGVGDGTIFWFHKQTGDS